LQNLAELTEGEQSDIELTDLLPLTAAQWASAWQRVKSRGRNSSEYQTRRKETNSEFAWKHLFLLLQSEKVKGRIKRKKRWEAHRSWPLVWQQGFFCVQQSFFGGCCSANGGLESQWMTRSRSAELFKHNRKLQTAFDRKCVIHCVFSDCWTVSRCRCNRCLDFPLKPSETCFFFLGLRRSSVSLSPFTLIQCAPQMSPSWPATTCVSCQDLHSEETSPGLFDNFDNLWSS
jgi:hypothetical protein